MFDEKQDLEDYLKIVGQTKAWFDSDFEAKDGGQDVDEGQTHSIVNQLKLKKKKSASIPQNFPPEEISMFHEEALKMYASGRTPDSFIENEYLHNLCEVCKYVTI